MIGYYYSIDSSPSLYISKLPPLTYTCPYGGTFDGTVCQKDLVPPTTSTLPAAGAYNSTQEVKLACIDWVSGCDKTHYTVDGSTPTTASAVYDASSPIIVSANATIKYFSTDKAGNAEAVKTGTFTFDTTPPVTSASLASGVFNTPQTVALSCSDAESGCNRIYYTADGTTPTISSSVYSAPINISSITTLKYFAVDNANNVEAVKSQLYIIDTSAPTTTASPTAGTFNTNINITLTCNDGVGSGCDKIYYTVDGTNPTSASLVYNSPINVSSTTTLKYFGVDMMSHAEAVKTQTYTRTYQTNFFAWTNGFLSGTTSQTINYGGTATAVTAVPATGYQFVNWTGPNGFYSTGATLTVSNITTDQNFTANFARPLIYRVAGNGTSGYSGDGGSAISAQLAAPMGMAVDNTGNMYIADLDNAVIRKVSAETGIITTVAGNGTQGFSGDGGPATSASLGGPGGVAIDGAGNLYISEISNGRIRKVDAGTGVISTVAGNGALIAGGPGDGGPATSASLVAPFGVTVDSVGNLYIVDPFGYSRIRKVDASTGIITTVAGNGTYGFSGDGGPATSASLCFAWGVAVDGNGNLYIADRNNNRIRKVTASTGIITTIAGTGVGASQYSGDGGPATSADFYSPYNVTVDSTGNVFFIDYGNRVRKVAAGTGIITTVAGSGLPVTYGDGGPPTAAGMSPVGITIDSAWNLYVADGSSNSIRKVMGTNFPVPYYQVTFTPGAHGTLSGPTSQSIYLGGIGTEVTAVPAVGFHLLNWTGPSGFVSTDNPLTIINVRATQTVTANFAINTYPLNFIAGVGGTVTGTASQTVSHGGNSTAVTAVPTAGYRFGNWTGTVGLVSSANPLTVTNVTGPQDITANFIKTYTAISTAGTGGTISASQTVDANARATFTITPATADYTTSVTGTCGGTLSGNSYTTAPLTSNCTVVASFIPCAGQHAKIARTGTTYATLQDAYNAALTGDQILVQALILQGDLTASTAKSVTFIGGYTCDFSSNPSVSYLQGVEHVTAGTVTMKNVFVHQ